MPSYTARVHSQRAVLYTLITLLGLLFVFPFFWMLISSVKLNKDVLAIPIHFFCSSASKHIVRIGCCGSVRSRCSFETEEDR